LRTKHNVVRTRAYANASETLHRRTSLEAAWLDIEQAGNMARNRKHVSLLANTTRTSVVSMATILVEVRVQTLGCLLSVSSSSDGCEEHEVCSEPDGEWLHARAHKFLTSECEESRLRTQGPLLEGASTAYIAYSNSFKQRLSRCTGALPSTSVRTRSASGTEKRKRAACDVPAPWLAQRARSLLAALLQC